MPLRLAIYNVIDKSFNPERNPYFSSSLYNMVSPVYAQPVFAIENLQDAFNLVSQGFEAYQNATQPDIAPKAAMADDLHKERPLKKVKTFQPDVDIVETSDSVIVEISLPGVDKSEISVEYDFESNRLLITGEAKRVDKEDHKPIRRERPIGPFERIVGLNKQIIYADRISGSHENGILTLTVPKNKELETKRKISIL